MVQINFAQKQINAKIVYYGPGMSGKTTNLEVVHQRAPAPNRGDLTSISTDGDRSLAFDKVVPPGQRARGLGVFQLLRLAVAHSAQQALDAGDGSLHGEP